MSMTNEVILAGVITTAPVREECFNGENICSFTLTVMNGDKSDEILVRVSDRFIDFKKIKVGAYIRVCGSLRSVNKSDGIKHLIVSVFASSISVSTESIPYENSVLLEGEICNKYYFKEAVGMRAQVCDRMLKTLRYAGKVSNIPIACRGRNAEYLSALETGTRVICKGVLRQRKYYKTIKGEKLLITTLEVVASTINCCVEDKT